MTKTLTGYDVDILNRHLMTVVINMHKPYFIFITYVMSWL